MFDQVSLKDHKYLIFFSILTSQPFLLDISLEAFRTMASRNDLLINFIMDAENDWEKYRERVERFNIVTLVEKGQLRSKEQNLTGYRANLLLLACYAGDNEAVTRILGNIRPQQGKKSILQDAMHQGQFPLHVAVRMAGNHEGGNAEIQRIFDNDTQEGIKIKAEIGNHVEVVKVLLEETKDLRDTDGNFALYYACVEGKVEIVKLMKEYALADAWEQALQGCADNINCHNVSNVMKELVSRTDMLKNCEFSFLVEVTKVIEAAAENALNHTFSEAENALNHTFSEVLTDMKTVVSERRYDPVDDFLSNLDKRADLVNGIIIVAALFATVATSNTFDGYGGKVGRRWEKAFNFFNTNSYSCAVASIMVGVSLLMPFSYAYLQGSKIERFTNRVLQWFIFFTIISGAVAFAISRSPFPAAISHQMYYLPIPLIIVFMFMVGFVLWFRFLIRCRVRRA